MTINSTSFSPYYSSGTPVASGYAQTTASVSLKKGLHYLIATSNLYYFLDSYSSYETTPPAGLVNGTISLAGGLFYMPKDDTVKFGAAGFQYVPESYMLYPNTQAISFPIVYDGTNYQTALISSVTVGTGAPATWGRIYHSTDLITWNTKTNGAQISVSTSNSSMNTFVYNGGVTEKYVWCGLTTQAAGSIWTSTDSITWTSRTLAGTVDNPGGVCINANATNKYVLYNRANTANPMCYSTDAVTWTNVTFTTAGTPIGVCATNDTASTDQIYVYGINSSGNNIITSTDAVTWTARSTGISAAVGGLLWFDSKYWAFTTASGRNFSTSTDGVTWTVTTAPFIITSASGRSRPFIANNKLFVQTANAWVATTNGTTWTNDVFNLQVSNPNQILYRDNKYFGISQSVFTGLSTTLPFGYIIYKVDEDPAIS